MRGAVNGIKLIDLSFNLPRAYMTLGAIEPKFCLLFF